MRVVLTVADHEQNGFVSLAQWVGMNESEARAFIAEQDALVSDDAEPDIMSAPFTFILDLFSQGDLIDTGEHSLPLQVAMKLAPKQVQEWLNKRPFPNDVLNNSIPVLGHS